MIYFLLKCLSGAEGRNDWLVAHGVVQMFTGGTGEECFIQWKPQGEQSLMTLSGSEPGSKPYVLHLGKNTLMISAGIFFFFIQMLGKFWYLSRLKSMQKFWSILMWPVWIWFYWFKCVILGFLKMSFGSKIVCID